MLTPGTEKQPQKFWPEIATLFLGLIMSGYAVWTQSNPWLISLVGMLTAVALVLLIRDSSLLRWWQENRLDLIANRIAKREYPRFVKMFERSRVHQDLVRELRNLDWKASPPPQFANMSFESWYSEISGSMLRLKKKKIKRATELELLADRFHDLFSVMNADYFRPFSEALRQGHAKYRNEQAEKSTRMAKEVYDRFLEAYKIFCEEVNEAASRRILRAIFNAPPAFDWHAAAPETTKGFTTIVDN